MTAKDRGVERGVHVPYVVKGPGVKRLGVTDELTDFAGIAPTLLDMAGLRYPRDVDFDGKSQLPYLTGRSGSHRQWIYSYTGPVQVLRTKTHLLEAYPTFTQAARSARQRAGPPDRAPLLRGRKRPV